MGMERSFEILIDRLKDGQTLKINEAFHPSFLEIEEKELSFDHPVAVKGEAYLTDRELILHLDAATKAQMPCSICNEKTFIKLEIKNFYHAQPIEEIPSAIYNFREILREALLIEVPPFVECNEGKCPVRATLAPYLRAEKRKEETYLPFSDLK